MDHLPLYIEMCMHTPGHAHTHKFEQPNNKNLISFAPSRHRLHTAGDTGVRGGAKRVPPPSRECGSDIPRRLRHVLLGPYSCTHNNVDVHRHECDTASRQPAYPQLSGQHHMPSHGSRTRQRELCAERDSEHAAAEPPGAFRCAQLQARRGP